MRMVQGVCADVLISGKLGEKLGTELMHVAMGRLRGLGHMLKKDDGDWVKEMSHLR